MRHQGPAGKSGRTKTAKKKSVVTVIRSRPGQGSEVPRFGSDQTKHDGSKTEVLPSEPVDMVAVKKNVTQLIWRSAECITKGVIEAAKKGQLAPAKYLFDMGGLYPATEEVKAGPVEESLPYSLLNRIAMFKEPGTGQ